MAKSRHSGSNRRQSRHVDEDSPDPKKTCCICYGGFRSDGTTRGAETPVQSPCGHVFGSTCISKWISISATCPLCRSQLPVIESKEEHNPNIGLDANTVIYVEYLTYSGVLCDLNALDWWFEEFESPREPQIAPAQPHIRRDRARCSKISRSGRRRANLGRSEYDDIWITALSKNVVCDVKPEVPDDHGFDDIEQGIKNCVSCFDDLLNSHKQWVAEAFACGGFERHDIFNFIV